MATKHDVTWLYGIDVTPQGVTALAVSSRDHDVSWKVEWDAEQDKMTCSCEHATIYGNKEEPTLREARRGYTFTDKQGCTRPLACAHEKLLARWITDRWEG